VNQYFQRFLCRVPGTEGSIFISELQNSATQEQVIAQILSSDEYYGNNRQAAATPEPATGVIFAVGVVVIGLSAQAPLDNVATYNGPK